MCVFVFWLKDSSVPPTPLSSPFNCIYSHALSRCKQRSTGPNITTLSLFPCIEATPLYMKAFITDVAVVCRNSITHEHSVNFGTGRHSPHCLLLGLNRISSTYEHAISGWPGLFQLYGATQGMQDIRLSAE